MKKLFLFIFLCLLLFGCEDMLDKQVEQKIAIISPSDSTIVCEVVEIIAEVSNNEEFVY